MKKNSNNNLNTFQEDIVKPSNKLQIARQYYTTQFKKDFKPNFFVSKYLVNFLDDRQKVEKDRIFKSLREQDISGKKQDHTDFKAHLKSLNGGQSLDNKYTDDNVNDILQAIYSKTLKLAKDGFDLYKVDNNFDIQGQLEEHKKEIHLQIKHALKINAIEPALDKFIQNSLKQSYTYLIINAYDEHYHSEQENIFEKFDEETSAELTQQVKSLLDKNKNKSAKLVNEILSKEGFVLNLNDDDLKTYFSKSDDNSRKEYIKQKLTQSYYNPLLRELVKINGGKQIDIITEEKLENSLKIINTVLSYVNDNKGHNLSKGVGAKAASAILGVVGKFVGEGNTEQAIKLGQAFSGVISGSGSSTVIIEFIRNSKNLKETANVLFALLQDKKYSNSVKEAVFSILGWLNNSKENDKSSFDFLVEYVAKELHPAIFGTAMGNNLPINPDDIDNLNNVSNYRNPSKMISDEIEERNLRNYEDTFKELSAKLDNYITKPAAEKEELKKFVKELKSQIEQDQNFIKDQKIPDSEGFFKKASNWMPWNWNSSVKPSAIIENLNKIELALNNNLEADKSFIQNNLQSIAAVLDKDNHRIINFGKEQLKSAVVQDPTYPHFKALVEEVLNLVSDKKFAEALKTKEEDVGLKAVSEVLLKLINSNEPAIELVNSEKRIWGLFSLVQEVFNIKTNGETDQTELNKFKSKIKCLAASMFLEFNNYKLMDPKKYTIANKSNLSIYEKDENGNDTNIVNENNVTTIIYSFMFSMLDAKFKEAFSVNTGQNNLTEINLDNLSSALSVNGSHRNAKVIEAIKNIENNLFEFIVNVEEKDFNSVINIIKSVQNIDEENGFPNFIRSLKSALENFHSNNNKIVNNLNNIINNFLTVVIETKQHDKLVGLIPSAINSSLIKKFGPIEAQKNEFYVNAEHEEEIKGILKGFLETLTTNIKYSDKLIPTFINCILDPSFIKDDSENGLDIDIPGYLRQFKAKFTEIMGSNSAELKAYEGTVAAGKEAFDKLLNSKYVKSILPKVLEKYSGEKNIEGSLTELRKNIIENKHWHELFKKLGNVGIKYLPDIIKNRNNIRKFICEEVLYTKDKNGNSIPSQEALEIVSLFKMEILPTLLNNEDTIDIARSVLKYIYSKKPGAKEFADVFASGEDHNSINNEKLLDLLQHIDDEFYIEKIASAIAPGEANKGSTWMYELNLLMKNKDSTNNGNTLSNIARLLQIGFSKDIYGAVKKVYDAFLSKNSKNNTTEQRIRDVFEIINKHNDLYGKLADDPAVRNILKQLINQPHRLNDFRELIGENYDNVQKFLKIAKALRMDVDVALKNLKSKDRRAALEEKLVLMVSNKASERIKGYFGMLGEPLVWYHIFRSIAVFFGMIAKAFVRLFKLQNKVYGPVVNNILVYYNADLKGDINSKRHIGDVITSSKEMKDLWISSPVKQDLSDLNFRNIEFKVPFKNLVLEGNFKHSTWEISDSKNLLICDHHKDGKQAKTNQFKGIKFTFNGENNPLEVKRYLRSEIIKGSIKFNSEEAKDKFLDAVNDYLRNNKVDVIDKQGLEFAREPNKKGKFVYKVINEKSNNNDLGNGIA